MNRLLDLGCSFRIFLLDIETVEGQYRKNDDQYANNDTVDNVLVFVEERQYSRYNVLFFLGLLNFFGAQIFCICHNYTSIFLRVQKYTFFEKNFTCLEHLK